MNGDICRLLPLMYMCGGFKRVDLPEPAGITHVNVYRGSQRVVSLELAGNGEGGGDQPTPLIIH